MEDKIIKQRVIAFLDKFFKEEFVVAEKELDFLDTNQLENATNVDYLMMKRFIFTAYNNLLEMDMKFSEGLVAKMFKDINNLTDYYNSFLKKIKISNLIYQRDFLDSVKEYKELEKDKENTNSKVNSFKRIVSVTQNELNDIAAKNIDVPIKKLKELKKRNVDAIYNLGKAKEHLEVVAKNLSNLEMQMKEIFFKHFKIYVEDLKGAFTEIINTKFYYFEHIMWNYAEQTIGVRKFFEKAGIKGDYSTKTYLEYYLKNIDIKKTGNESWHKYLQNILEILK